MEVAVGIVEQRQLFSMIMQDRILHGSPSKNWGSWAGMFCLTQPTLPMLPLRIFIYSDRSSSLRGHSFTGQEEVKQHLDNFRAKPKEFFERGIDLLVEKWEKIVENNGKYFD